MSQDTLTIPLPSLRIQAGSSERYALTARVVDADAGALVAGWHELNQPAPAGLKYVVVEMSMVGVDEDGVEPSLANFDVYLSTGAAELHDAEYIIFSDAMPSMLAGSKLYPGDSFTGYAAYLVPRSASAFMLIDNGARVAL